MKGARLRLAGLEDASAIAEIRVASWRAAYRDLLPAELLAGLRVEDGERRICRLMVDGRQRFWLLEDGGSALGFADFGLGEQPGVAELRACYLRREAWGLGLGRRLMARLLRDMIEKGYHGASLYVMEGNRRARRFYEAAGWRAEGGSVERLRGGRRCRDLRYRISLV